MPTASRKASGADEKRICTTACCKASRVDEKNLHRGGVDIRRFVFLFAGR